MKTAKLGAIFLVSTIALAGIGAAYAWWQEELVIDVEVKLGTFGWEWSPVDIYVTHDYKEIIDADAWLSETHEPTDPGYGHNDKLNFYADQVYPCTDLEIYTDIHFWGSVPGHIYDITYNIYLDGSQIDLPPWMFVMVEVEDGDKDLFDQMGIAPGAYMSICDFFDLLTPTQWHECYRLYLFIYIHWIQWDMEFVDPWGNTHGPWLGQTFDVPMDATLEFDITINGCQFNDPDYGGPIT